MAPQNSTLIHENFELTSESSRYSPIPPLKEEGNDGRRKKSISSKAINIQEDDEIPIWICGEPRFISGITCNTTCNEIIQALINDELHNDDANGQSVGGGGGGGGGVGRRNGGYGGSNNNQQSITETSRDLNDYVITERWRDVEQALSGETHILPIWKAWGGARNEVIFKLKINKNQVGQTMLGYKKKENELQKKKRNKLSSLSKMMRQLVRQSETIQERLAQINDQKLERQMCMNNKPGGRHQNRGKTILMENFLRDTAATAKDEPRVIENIYVNLYKQNDKPDPINLQGTDDDELFVLIDNQSSCGRRPITESDSGINIEYRQYVLNQKYNESLKLPLTNLANQVKLQETPKRKLRTKFDLDQLRLHSLNRKLHSPKKSSFIDIDDHNKAFPRNLPELQKTSSRLDEIRYEITKRIVDMHHLLQYEEDVTTNLSTLYARFRAQNEQYETAGLKICIEEVQKKLDAYTKDIVENEFELFKVKLEISQKCGILHNLKRMLKMEDVHEGHGKKEDFVDNFYEFNDNNKSILV